MAFFYESPPYLLFIIIQLFFVKKLLLFFLVKTLLLFTWKFNFCNFFFIIIIIIIIEESPSITILKWSLLGAVIANQSSPSVQLLDLFGLLVQQHPPPPWDETLDETYGWTLMEFKPACFCEFVMVCFLRWIFFAQSSAKILTYFSNGHSLKIQV